MQAVPLNFFGKKTYIKTKLSAFKYILEQIQCSLNILGLDNNEN